VISPALRDTGAVRFHGVPFARLRPFVEGRSFVVIDVCLTDCYNEHIIVNSSIELEGEFIQQTQQRSRDQAARDFCLLLLPLSQNDMNMDEASTSGGRI